MSTFSKRVLRFVPAFARWTRVTLCSLAIVCVNATALHAQTVRGPGMGPRPGSDAGAAVPEIHGTSTRAALAILFLGALILMARKRAAKVSDSAA